MRTFTHPLGDDLVTVFAPEPGDPAAATLRLYFPPGGTYGLDMESTGFEDPVNEPGQTSVRSGPGPFHPRWRMRLIQFGTEHYAWALNVDDPVQRAAAIDLLSDPNVQFTSHTAIDPIAVSLEFGVDIASRVIDTYFLSVMASPSHRDGGNELKPHVTRLIGPQLAGLDSKLQDRFVELYNDAHPYKLDDEGNPIPRKDGTFRKATAQKVSKVTGDAPRRVAAWGFTNIPIDDETYLTYAGLDAVAVRRVLPMLRAETQAPASLVGTETWLSQQSIRISRRGHLVDEDRLHEMYVRTRDAMREPEALVLELTGGISPRSPKIVEYFTERGIDWTEHPKTPSGGPSLAKDHVTLLRSYDLPPEAHKVVEALISYKGLLNRYTVTQQVIDKVVDGVLHPTIKTIGTVTGRMSGSNPNMQNFSKSDPEMRMLFRARPGHVLLSCDFAQIELRVMAALAQEPQMTATIMEGDDLHTLTARLLGLPDPLGKGRKQAKTVNFLIVYGGGGRKLAAQLGFPDDWGREQWISHCYDIVRQYWAQYPKITAYKELVERRDVIQLLSGRRIPVDPYRTYANLNYCIQGSARELLAGAWMRLGRGFGRAEYVWMPIHDELVLEVPEGLADVVAAEVAESMSFDFGGVPVVADPDFLIDGDGDSRWMSGDYGRAINPRCGEKFGAPIRKCGRLVDHDGAHGVFATLDELRADTARNRSAAS